MKSSDRRKHVTVKLLNVADERAGLESLHFVLMTIGSRGDVQPLIVLGIGQSFFLFRWDCELMRVGV